MDKYDGIWDPGCGGFVGGKTAVDYYEEGFFKHPWGIPTTWERGTNQGNLGFRLRVRCCMDSKLLISGGLKFSLQKFFGNPKPITEADMPTDYVKSKMENFGK